MYITYYIPEKTNLNLNFNNPLDSTTISTAAQFRTIKTTHIKPNPKINEYLQNIYNTLHPFENTHDTEYYTFKIPKRTGGLRTISAPNPAFKAALTQAKDILQNKIKCLPHAAAYAYVKNKSTLDAVKLHQKNQSHYYLKIDLKNFFPNCTKDLMFTLLKKIYPFAALDEQGDILLKKILKIVTINNELPQGSPISPILTNLIMVSYDYEISKYLQTYTKHIFRYTRYADDILISSRENFKTELEDIIKNLKEILNPFTIKDEKTRYGSINGRNWNLGLMINKENKITIGYRKKKLLSAMLHNFVMSFNKIKWPVEDVQALQGQLAYLKHIEPTYYQTLLNKYNNKYNINIQDMFKTILKNA